MIKKLASLFFIGSLLFTLTACDFDKDNMEDIDIYTTNYATEFITEKIYGEHANIVSIYPNGIDVNNYKLTNKQLVDYSKSDLYIFNGLNAKEKSYATKMRNKNSNLKIIDTTLAMEYENSVEELWLDPSNFLMLAQNIKKGFKEYTNSYYLKNDIDKNYENLKIEASNLDAKIKSTIEKADKKVIVASSDMFKFLEKYDLTVYSLEKGLDSENIDKIKSLINNGQIKYIFTKENEELSYDIKGLILNTNIKTLSFNTLTNLNEDKKKENADYFSIMNENIDNLKSELYN